jgi:hypothetical protein
VNNRSTFFSLQDVHKRKKQRSKHTESRTMGLQIKEIIPSVYSYKNIKKGLPDEAAPLENLEKINIRNSASN